MGRVDRFLQTPRLSVQAHGKDLVYAYLEQPKHVLQDVNPAGNDVEPLRDLEIRFEGAIERFEIREGPEELLRRDDRSASIDPTQASNLQLGRTGESIMEPTSEMLTRKRKSRPICFMISLRDICGGEEVSFQRLVSAKGEGHHAPGSCLTQ